MHSNKTTKHGKHYVCKSPQTYEVYELLQNFPGISQVFLKHKFYKLSQSVKALHKAYSDLGPKLGRPINPLFYLMSNIYKTSYLL